MNIQSNNKFNFFIPATFEKGKKGNKDVVRVKGIASTASSIDSDGETLFPEGFDYSPLLSKGFLNWDHQQKGRPSAIIGEPDVAKVINGGKDFYIEGFLYNSEEARQVSELAETLEKNSPTRRLGYSIEGQVIERGCGPEFLDKEKTLRNSEYSDSLWRQVKKARITGVAITPCPKNPNTLLSLMKGEYSEQFVDVEGDEFCPKCITTALKNGKCPECGYIEKAMSAEGASDAGLIPEHIEGTKNPNKYPLDNDKEHAVGRFIKKSDCYNLIASNYTTDVVKANQIFNLIKSVNQKLYNMESNQISQEAIDQAFEFLSKAAEDNMGMDKSKGAEVKVKDEDNDEDDMMAKAKEMCKGLMKDGKSNDEAIEGMIKGGFSLSVSSSTAATVASEMSNLKENGGTISAASAEGGNTDGEQSLKKGEDIDLGKLFLETFSETNEIIKGMNSTINANMDHKFSAVGKILKVAVDQNELLKGELNELKTEFNRKIELIEQSAQPTKSSRNVQAMERFAKSESTESKLPIGTNIYNLNSRDDRNALADIMQGQIEKSRSEGLKPNTMLEKAISELEIAKQLNPEILPMLRAMNIAVERK
jgi:hypothetical protein